VGQALYQTIEKATTNSLASEILMNKELQVRSGSGSTFATTQTKAVTLCISKANNRLILWKSNFATALLRNWADFWH